LSGSLGSRRPDARDEDGLDTRPLLGDVTDELASDGRSRSALVSRMAKGERVAPTTDTFETFAESWLATQGHLRPHTRAVYELAIRLHLNPVLGDRKLASIDEDDVLKVIARMRTSGAAPWTIKGVLTPSGGS
jgi:hypothetical protein